MSDDAGSTPAEDLLLLHSPTEDGAGVRVVRSKDSKVELGELRPIREGQPITGELVSLSPRTFDAAGAPRVCDVKVLYDPRHRRPAQQAQQAQQAQSTNEPARSGPAQVATEAYRQSWEAIFGGKISEKPAPGGKLTN